MTICWLLWSAEKLNKMEILIDANDTVPHQFCISKKYVIEIQWNF